MHTWGVYSRVTYWLLITFTWLHNRYCLWTIALLGCSFHAIQFIDCDEPYGSFIIVFKVYHSFGPIFAYSSSCITITEFRPLLSALKETTLASSHTLSTSFPVPTSELLIPKWGRQKMDKYIVFSAIDAWREIEEGRAWAGVGGEMAAVWIILRE